MARGDPQYSGPFSDAVGALDRPVMAVEATSYGARGDGTTDNRSPLAAAINAMASAGGGTVLLPAGTYTVTTSPHPTDAAYRAAIVLPTGVSLRGAGQGATVIRLANNEPGQSDVFTAVVMNAQLGGGAHDLTITDLTIDGNNLNQTKTHYGIAFIRVRDVTVERVTCKNLRGTATSGPNENFHFEVELSSNVAYSDCLALADAGSTASGFSANGCTGIRYVNCVAQGMSVTNGFTHNGCAHIQHTGCWAHSNTGSGFNSEVSTHVVYAACTGGAIAVTPAVSYPFTAGGNLGNNIGFVLNGSTNVVLDGCTGRGNDGAGVFCINSPTGRITGGTYADNGTQGVWLGAAPTVEVTGRPMFSGNTVGAVGSTAGGTSAASGLLAAPSFPATTVALANPYPFPVDVYLSGGTVASVSIAGTVTGVTSGLVRVPFGATIAAAYTGSPSWTWWAAT